MNKLALLVLALAACQPDTKNLERKMDQILAEIKTIKAGGGGAAPGARPARPEPNPAKTYAVSVEGDGFVGPPDAKITIVEAFDYG
jgi:protein-disulfide isomerase